MTERYSVVVTPLQFGDDVIVLDHESHVQIAARTTEGMAPNLIAAIISDHRERQNGIVPGVKFDEDASRRRSAAKRAATALFRDEEKADRWLLTPTQRTGWRIPRSLVSANDEGLNFVLALLDVTETASDEPLDRFERVLSARGPEATVLPREDVQVINTVSLLGDESAGHTAWLLGLPGNRTEIAIEPVGWPYDAHTILQARLRAYREATNHLEAFIAEARRLGAFDESAASA